MMCLSSVHARTRDASYGSDPLHTRSPRAPPSQNQLLACAAGAVLGKFALSLAVGACDHTGIAYCEAQRKLCRATIQACCRFVNTDQRRCLGKQPMARVRRQNQEAFFDKLEMRRALITVHYRNALQDHPARRARVLPHPQGQVFLKPRIITPPLPPSRPRARRHRALRARSTPADGHETLPRPWRFCQATCCVGAGTVWCWYHS